MNPLYKDYLTTNIGPATTAGGLPVVQKPILQPSVPSIFGTAPALQVNNGTPLPGLTYNTPGTVLTTTKPIAPKQVLPTVAPGSVASIGAYKGIPIKAGPDSYIQQQMSEIDAKSNTTPTTTTTAPAPGSVGSIAPTPIPYTYTKTPQEIADEQLRQQIEDYNKEQFNLSIDKNVIYNEQLKQQQAYIDSLNAMYNDRLNEARKQGLARIESRQFAQGRAGQIGSKTGEAGINAVQDANTEILKAIEDEQKVAIQVVYGNVRKEALDEFTRRTEAKKAGADALLKDITERPTRRKAAITSAIKAAIVNGLDISKLTDDEIKQIFGELGVSKGEILSEYNTQKQANEKFKLEREKELLEMKKTEADIRKIDAEIKKGTLIEMSEGGMLYDTVTGKTFKNPKTFAPSENSKTKTPTAEEIKQSIRPMLATQTFKNMKKQQKVDYILSQGGDPADFGY